MKKLITLFILGLCVAAFAVTQPLDRDLEQAAISQSPDRITESATPAWEILTQMSDIEKANCVIDLEMPSGIAQDAIQTASMVENLWNSGQYNTAIALLRNLATEVMDGTIAIGMSWRTPLASEDASLWGPDVRIGTRDSIYQSSMDIIHSTGTLFCILTLKQGSSYYFTVNRSANSGQTWTETFAWSGGDSLRSASATCVSGVCWVGYSYKVYPYQARVRRFSGTTGQTLPFAGGGEYDTIFTATAPDSIREMVMFSNQDNYNNRVYCMLITKNGNLRYFWSDTAGATWTQVSTGITNASRGLSATWNENFVSRPYWFSFINQNDSLMVYSKSSPDTITLGYAGAIGSNTRYTSIGAYHDTVFCAYEYSVSGFGCRYRVCYSGTWTWGYLAETDTTIESPAVALRNGGGISAVYRYYSDQRRGHYIHRTYPYTPWSTAVAYTNNELWWNKPSLEYLGSGDYGVVYLTTNSPAFHAAYFDRLAASDIEMTPTLPNAFALNQNYPNPFNAKTCVQYNLPKSADVKLEIYDILGRKVQTLNNGFQEAGPHSLIWNAEDFSSGVYFARITVDGETHSIRMTLLK